MRTLTQTLAALTLLTAPLALAQSDEAAQLCQNSLEDDVQPNFNNLNLNGTIKLVGTDEPRKLQLDTNLERLNTERILFPFDQNITISYVYESAGASHALGYMYLDDMVRAGYVNGETGALNDANSNGIYDLHEDIFNVAPTSGTQARTYVGQTGRRRCNRPFISGGFTYSQPDLAMNSNCDNTFSANQSLRDGRPNTSALITTDIVGAQSGSNASEGFSDRGLFPHIPNLLEPAAPANGNRGLGKMVFLLADDDSFTTTFNNLSPVSDTGIFGEGIPDYDVSLYDPEGRQRGTNPNPGISNYDRTVDLGLIRGGREIVFFLVVWYNSAHDVEPNHDQHGIPVTVYPCLKQNAAGQCTLHLRTSTNVFFSKTDWNLDQNPKNAANVATRNIGCGYDEGCGPDDISATRAPACQIGTTSEWACGWLDDATLDRLADSDIFGNLVMPTEKVVVPRPVNTRNPMPHVIVGAPTTDPFRWILGFEDIPGGGDRDFNDVVFVINKQNGGTAHSTTVSGDISIDIPEEAQDFVITKVRFRRQDDTTRSCGPGTPPCWTEEPAGSGGCAPANGVEPSINYSLAVDCRLWDETGGVDGNGDWVVNARPTWIPVDFSNTPAPHNEVELDLMAMGYTGSQLCWKVDIVSPSDRCVPVIDNVDIGYQAVRSGTYSRASPTTLGNAIAWGLNETPGRAWGTNWPGTGMPAATTRAYDHRKDYSVRGRLYFRSLYDPERSNVTNTVQRWDGGRELAEDFAEGKDPMTRLLYTMNGSGRRTEVKAEAEGMDADSILFPDGLCDAIYEREGSRYLWDVNRDTRCGTPSNIEDRRIEDDTNDRNFFLEWLYGWEHKHNGVKRPWPMGGVNLSTVAMAVPPYLDTWATNSLPNERDLYRENFMKALKDRRTVGYVGTMSGFLHAFDSGAFRNESRDLCAGGYQLRGLFRILGTDCVDPISPRDYGTGDELFAYLPRLMLPYYRNLYVPVPTPPNQPPAEKPTLDASPTIANVDFRDLGDLPAWTPSPTESRTTGAKTVLVSSSGKEGRAVFALDITNPEDDWYPLPLWEFDIKGSAIVTAFEAARDDEDDPQPTIVLPDNSGSRHAPSVARLSWGTTSTQPGVWAAVIGTDYSPRSLDQAGTLYVLDMKTGAPLNFGDSDDGRMAGVITLDQGSGIAAESALVDLNRDGNYDVMYTPTTAGNVYRINLQQIDVTAPLGQKVKRCLVASAPVAVTDNPQAAEESTYQDPIHQQIHSNLAVKVIRDSANPSVQFFFGTSDNPDLLLDGPKNSEGEPDKSQYIYHLLAFEDLDPWGKEDCELLDPMWVQKLHPGQTVWGGVSLTAEKVYATTAVGASADICNLSRESGRFYESGQLPNGTNAPGMTSALLGGHGINAPVVHDQHLFVLTATGQMKMMGNDNWNTGTADTGATRTRVLIYDPNPEGRLPK